MVGAASQLPECDDDAAISLALSTSGVDLFILLANGLRPDKPCIKRTCM